VTTNDASGADLNRPSGRVRGAWNRDRLPVVPRWLATIGIVAVLLAASAWVIGQQFGSSSPSHHGAKHAATVPTGFTKFKDPGTFEISYPSSWKRLQTSGSQAALLVSGPAGASFLVSKLGLRTAVTTGNLAAAKPLTDHVVNSGKDVKYLKAPQAVSLGGLPGILYIYTFTDRANGQQGAHAHYFLFDGKTMFTIVFQSLPSTGLLAEAPSFDRIAQTFQPLG
jgi:hypothetical protein